MGQSCLSKFSCLQDKLFEDRNNFHILQFQQSLFLWVDKNQESVVLLFFHLQFSIVQGMHILYSSYNKQGKILKENNPEYCMIKVIKYKGVLKIHTALETIFMFWATIIVNCFSLVTRNMRSIGILITGRFLLSTNISSVTGRDKPLPT